MITEASPTALMDLPDHALLLILQHLRRSRGVTPRTFWPLRLLNARFSRLVMTPVLWEELQISTNQYHNSWPVAEAAAIPLLWRIGIHVRALSVLHCKDREMFLAILMLVPNIISLAMNDVLVQWHVEFRFAADHFFTREFSLPHLEVLSASVDFVVMDVLDWIVSRSASLHSLFLDAPLSSRYKRQLLDLGRYQWPSVLSLWLEWHGSADSDDWTNSTNSTDSTNSDEIWPFLSQLLCMVPNSIILYLDDLAFSAIVKEQGTPTVREPLLRFVPSRTVLFATSSDECPEFDGAPTLGLQLLPNLRFLKFHAWRKVGPHTLRFPHVRVIGELCDLFGTVGALFGPRRAFGLKQLASFM